jgi:glycogen operon protein
MVKALHAAGIEVILDVVYNHTGEGNEFGPTVSFRGIDNSGMYRLVYGAERYYMDYTGTGNCLNGSAPQTLKLIMDSLRYWVREMRVDGFRFDLATVLARHLHEVDRFSPFLDVIHQDPVLSGVKLIAEPWDIGEGGYQVGNFPWPWSEWNGRYRDTVRRFWRGDQGCMSDLAERLIGSPDLYADDRRHPQASINFITAHDGFTLADLVSYNLKHNEANGEGNRDGTDANWSSNHGWEGPTDDPAIDALRARQQRNLLATLLLSQGVPMLCGGDEIGRTQHGNNNAYCQDNELSWFDWDLDERRRALLDFTRSIIAVRRTHPLFHLHHFTGETQPEGGEVEAHWLRPDGAPMTARDWDTPWIHAIALRLTATGPDGSEIDDHLLLLNGSHNGVVFTLPGSPPDMSWQTLIDTTAAPPSIEAASLAGGTARLLEHRSLVLLQASQSHESNTA